jgi:xanthine dehydrogenase iron-sulfur cluster and FAD-binding subunit A
MLRFFIVDPSNGSINTESMLVDFIRDVAHLKGTKLMCREGGCGACVVTAAYRDPGTGTEVVKGINSVIRKFNYHYSMIK